MVLHNLARPVRSKSPGRPGSSALYLPWQIKNLDTWEILPRQPHPQHRQQYWKRI